MAAPATGAPPMDRPMSPQRLLPSLISVLVLSVLGMAVGGRLGASWLVLGSAATFSVAAMAVAINVNLPYWREHIPFAGLEDETVAALRRNARLTAIVYAWGAIGMQSLYTTALTGLKWQHGWQYALVMLLLALGAFQFSQALAERDPRKRRPWLDTAVPLCIANGMLGAGGLAYLVIRGKLQVLRPDWAANLVFVFIALTMMVLAAVTLRTHARLTNN